MTTRTVMGNTYTFGYYYENRLTSVSGATTATFTYDGDGNRVKSVVGATTTLFVGSHYESSGGVVTKYYLAGGTRLAMRKGSTFYWLLSDHLGSTSKVATATGALHSQQLYKAWGESRYTSGTLPTRYTYTGQYSYASDFGLVFYSSRFYDPLLARWASPDSIIPEAAQGTQAWDRYSYVNNSPLNYTDPTGHCIFFCAVALGALVGGIVSSGASAYIQYQQTGVVTFEQTASAFIGGAVTGGIMAAAAPASLVAAFVAGGAANVAGNQAASATTAMLNPTEDGFWNDFANSGGLFDGSNVTNVGEAATDFVIGGTFSAIATGVNNKLFPLPKSGPSYYTVKYQVDYINQTSGWARVGGGYPLASSSSWGAVGGLINAIGRKTVDAFAEYGTQVIDYIEDLIIPE